MKRNIKNGNKLGSVKNLAVDLESVRIVKVIIFNGGEKEC